MTQNSEHTVLWNKCLKIIEGKISQQEYKSWFEPIKSVQYEDNKILLCAPSSFFIERIEETYILLLANTIKSVYGPNAKLSYTYDVIKNDAQTRVVMDAPNDSVAVNKNKVHNVEPLKAPFGQQIEYPEIDSQLNPHYTFENYCGSQSNQLALSIGNAIATRPECKTFNPLLIFGKTGVGKTHLIQAIGIKIKETNPKARVLYLTARVFESQYTSAVTKNQFNDFMNFYQSIDVLIMDDIQEFAGKEKTQNTFYHIFNHLHQKQKQLILSSDCPPVDLEGIIPRLMSRFKWGVTVELYQPDYVLRRLVLEKKAKEDGLTIPNDVLDFIANTVTDSVRELEGIIVSLITRATFMSQEISIDMARSVISNSVRISKKQLTFEFIVETVCSYFNIDSELLYGKSRKRDISDARQIIMYLAKKYTQLSSTTIGMKLSRDHATVLYACKIIEERVTIDKQLESEIQEIENEFKK